MRSLSQFALFLLSFFCFAVLVCGFSPNQYYNKYHYDCGVPNQNDTRQYFCQVTYTYALILNDTETQSYYYKIASYMHLNVSLNNAYEIYQDLVKDNDVDESCRSAISSFACHLALPHCPNYNSFSQPWTVCRSECLYVKKFCPYMDIDCNELRDDPSICFRVKDANTDILQVTTGHRWLWPLHIALSAYYILLLIFWHIMSVRNHNICNSLQSAFTPSLYIKIVASLCSIIVWWQIDYTEGLNYNTWSVVMLCSNLLFQTYFIADLLMFSKGWCIITSNYIRDDWIHTYIMALLYYIVVCIVNLSSLDTYNLFMYHFYCILITTLIFVHVLYNIYDAFQDCYQKMLILNNDGLSPYLSPAYAKYMIFQWQLLFIVLQYVLFLFRHILIPLLDTYVGLETTVFWDIFISEVAFVLLMTFFTVVFYPREDCVLYTNLQGENEDDLSSMPPLKSLKEYHPYNFNRLKKVSEIVCLLLFLSKTQAVALPDDSICIGKKSLDRREIYQTPQPEEESPEDESNDDPDGVEQRSGSSDEYLAGMLRHYAHSYDSYTSPSGGHSVDRGSPSQTPVEEEPEGHRDGEASPQDDRSDSEDSYVPRSYVISN